MRFSKLLRVEFIAILIAACAFASDSALAQGAGTYSYSVTDPTGSWSGNGTTYGNLGSGTQATTIILNPASGYITLPATVTFGDNLGANLTGNAYTYIDNYEFMVMPAVLSASVGGVDMSLTNFSISGSVESFYLCSGTPTGTNALITSGTVTSSFQQLLLDDITKSGNYFLQVQATDNATSVASYSGTVVLAAVPEPTTFLLMGAGLGLVGLAVRRRGARN